MPEIQAISLYFTLFISLFFEIFLLITYLEVRAEMKFENEHLDREILSHPSVSIMVPCFNEERTVDGTIQSILDLDYPKEKLSIIVIDDGSTDSTLEILKKYENHPQVQVLSKENGGKHTALNYALTHIESDLVGCLDADSFVNSDALRKIVPFFEDEKIMAVTPSIKVHDPDTVIQRVQKIEYSWGVFLRRMLSSIGALYVTPGPFSIFRRRVFNEIGGYKHAHHTEDLELALRMQKNRYKIVNSLNAHVYTVAPRKFKQLYKQRVRWTYGFLNNAVDYKDMYFNKKYGHIGLFILPIATISIFTTLYAFLNLMWIAGTNVADFITKYQTVGFQWKTPEFSFDWFFLSTDVISVLAAIALFLTLAILGVSLKVAEGKIKVNRDIFYYLFLYIFLPPTWLAKSVYNTVMKRNIKWR